MHLLRTTPSFPAAASFDDLLRSFLDSYLLSSMSDSEYTRASFPLRYGGLGLLSASVISPIAYLCSRIAANASLSAALSLPPARCFEDLLIRYPPDITAAYLPSSIADEALSPEPTAHLQRACLHRLYDSMSTTFTLTQTRILQLHHDTQINSLSYRFLTSVINPARNTRYSSIDFRILCLFRLGIPLFPPDALCVFCNRPMDIYGYHSFSCRHTPGIIWRHNASRNILYRLASSCQRRSRIEDSSFRPTFRIDLSIDNFIRGATGLLDVSIINPFADSHIAAAHASLSGLLSSHYTRKLNHASGVFFSAVPNAVLLPIISDFCGNIHPESFKTLRSLAPLHALASGYSESSAFSFILDSWSSTLFKCNARMLVSRFHSRVRYEYVGD